MRATKSYRLFSNSRVVFNLKIMKKIELSFFLLMFLLLTNCKKSGHILESASVNVVNASIGVSTIKVNYNGEPVVWKSYTGAIGLINYGTNQILPIFKPSKTYPLHIVSATDTTIKVFEKAIDFASHKRFTLFTCGQVNNYDGVLVQENNLSYNSVDSVISIRFINLSPNSPRIKIKLSINSGNEIEELGYKEITSFKSYKVAKIIPNGSLTFEVRDALSNALLSSYTIPVSPVAPYSNVSASLSRFKSLTLAIKGLAGITTGVNSYSIFPVTHY